MEVYVERSPAPGFMAEGTLRTNAAYRHQPGHVETAAPERFAGMVYQGRF
ncbi:MAG: hypothetical protein JJU06_05565 [Ectothiorhodospiraceae bacterium]|nr:hypothetical protein [Ectothiorhodospiraceae bacterium]MCH8503994.1 hypothetical protein [Ectothiorhodospiraceae bacterium]